MCSACSGDYENPESRLPSTDDKLDQAVDILIEAIQVLAQTLGITFNEARKLLREAEMSLV